ncbi:MAG: histidine phosphatase family protein [Geodermatophilaceae bacterium]|nr:histidine phosphatase family protein [Geodermatophilaceae bacterium]MDQ3456044.1 histidine phosphatase family protein [Actinomycetota bacterium]
MSAPHCPATVLVVRHAEATYDRPDVPSDEGGWLTERGRQQAERLAEILGTRRVAAVYTSELQRARETGAILAERLVVRCHDLPGVEEFRVGEYGGRRDGGPAIVAVFDRWLAGDLDAACPGGDSARQVGARFAAALEEVADQHRGETVVVVSHGGAMALALPSLCGNASPALRQAHWLPHCGLAEVSIGAQGWELGPWPGSTDQLVAEPAR